MSDPECPLCGSEGFREDTSPPHYSCDNGECPVVTFTTRVYS